MSDSMKKILFALTILALTFSLVEACSNPILRNEYGVPVALYGSGYITIDADNYPEGTQEVDYNLEIENTNDDTNLTFTLTPDSNLAAYVDTLEIFLEPGQTTDIELHVSIMSTREGTLEATGQCGDGLSIAEGSMGLKIYASGDSPGGDDVCDNTIFSCGTYPDCKDLTQMTGCYQGYYRSSYYCSSNTIKYSEICTNTCCRNYYGSDAYCQGGVCVSPSNSAPIIRNYTPTDLTPTIRAGNSLEFTQNSVDPDYGTLTYSWLLDGTEESTSASWTFTTTESDMGVYNVTFIVSDGSRTASQEWEVTVTEDLNLANGESCSENDDCESGYCVHGTCRASSTYCGDGYCDSGETCSSCSSDCGTCDTGGDSGGSSGGSSGGGGFGGSTSGGTTKTTGFYDFPSYARVEAGEEIIVEGKFYNKFQGDKDVDFKISGIDNNWFEISPSSTTVSYDEEVDIMITFNLPQNVESGDYPFKISTDIGSMTYEEEVTLVVSVSQVTTTEEPTTTLEEGEFEATNEEENNSPMSAFMIRAGDFAKGYWFLILVPVALLLFWKFVGIPVVKITPNNPGHNPSGNPGKIVDNSDDGGNAPVQEKEYVEVKVKEAKPEQEAPKVKKQDPALDKARQRVIEEMRTRAMKMEKFY